MAEAEAAPRRLISNTTKHQQTMDAEAIQAKFAIHQACREGQSMYHFIQALQITG